MSDPKEMQEVDSRKTKQSKNRNWKTMPKQKKVQKDSFLPGRTGHPNEKKTTPKKNKLKKPTSNQEAVSLKSLMGTIAKHKDSDKRERILNKSPEAIF